MHLQLAQTRVEQPPAPLAAATLLQKNLIDRAPPFQIHESNIVHINNILLTTFLLGRIFSSGQYECHLATRSMAILPGMPIRIHPALPFTTDNESAYHPDWRVHVDTAAIGGLAKKELQTLPRGVKSDI